MFPSLVAQLKVAPGVEEDPFSITKVVVQVRVLSEPAFALGGVLFNNTMAVSLALHPFAGFVIIKI